MLLSQGNTKNRRRAENVLSIIMLKRILEDGNVYTRSSVNSSQLHARLSNNRSNLRPRDRIRKPDATIQRGNQTETRANTRHSTAKPYARSASDPKVFPSCRVENPKAETIVSSQVLVFPFVGISFQNYIETVGPIFSFERCFKNVILYVFVE